MKSVVRIDGAGPFREAEIFRERGSVEELSSWIKLLVSLLRRSRKSTDLDVLHKTSQM